MALILGVNFFTFHCYDSTCMIHIYVEKTVFRIVALAKANFG